MLEEPGISHAEIAAIHALEDDSMRNNEITLAYHELSLLLKDFTRSDTVNWPGWAKWTSKTIGVGIRWHEVRSLTEAAAEAGTDDLLNQWIGRRARRYVAIGAVMRLLTTATRLAERSLAFGNRDVFFEIATAVRSLVDEFGERTPTVDEITAWAATLEPVPEEGSLGEAPIERFRDGIACFGKARIAATDDERGELVLAANIHIAAYEQLRLQQVVERSLSSPVTHVLKPVEALLRAMTGREKPVEGATRWLAETTVELLTRHVLVVVTGDEVVRLGRPVTGPNGGPYDVAYWERTADTPELREAIGLAPEHPDRFAPTRWTDYDQRVRFTAALFASRHHHAAIAGKPMTTRETTIIKDERRTRLLKRPRITLNRQGREVDRSGNEVYRSF